MDFENILTGARARSPHGQKERLVKRGAVPVEESRQGEPSRRRRAAAKCRRNIKCPRATDPDHRNGGPARRRRLRENGVGGVPHGAFVPFEADIA